MNHLLLLISCLLMSIYSLAQPNPDYLPGELFIQFRPGTADYLSLTSDRLPASVSAVIGELGSDKWSRAFRLRTPELQGILHVKLADTTDLERLIEKLESHPDINYAERVPNYQLFYTPDDLAPQQWGLDKVQAEDAWDLATGSSNVVVAIVDDAVQIGHPDLSANIWTNPGEIPNNNIDDDGNGYVDDVNGYDVAMNDNDVNPPGITANGGLFHHGTHCAGISSAATDNNTGIAAIGFNVTIMPVKVAEDQNASFIATLQGVEYAIINQADVISMSWGGGGYSQTYQLLFNQAYQQGIVCVGAAGNNNTNIPMYPASYNHVINVGSTNQQDQRSGFSSYGTTVDVMAPGSSIWSTVPDYVGYYDYLSGTSMACPLVSGLAALIKSARPGFTVDEITDCILSTADDISNQNPGYPGQLGSGRINAYEAVKCAVTCGFTVSKDKSQVCPGDTVHYFGTFDSLVSNFQWSFPGGVPSTSTDTNPVVVYPNAGVYDYSIEVTCPLGIQVHTYPDVITVAVPMASIMGSYSVIYGSTVLITTNLTGLPPYTIKYTDGVDTFTQSGIANSPFLLPYTALRNDTVYLLSITDGNCAGTVSGMVEINLISNDSCTNGQASGQIFQNTYKDFADLVTHTVERDEYGFLYITGYYRTSQTTDYFVSKLDSVGKILWTTTAGEPDSNERGRPMNVLPTSDGSVYVGSGDTEARVSKLDPSGNLLWTVGTPPGANDFIRIMRELPSGNVLAFGTSNSFGPRPSDPFVMKVTPAGVVPWYKTVAGATSNDHINDIEIIGPNELIWGGHTQSFGLPPRAGLVCKSDTNGALIWEKCYSTGSENWIRNIAVTQTSIVAVGTHYNTPIGDQMIVMSLDLQGNLIWARNYRYGNETTGVDVEVAPGGGFYLSGTVRDVSGEQIFMAHIDDVGNPLWSKKYGGALPSTIFVRGHNLAISNTGVVLAGTASNGSYVIQTDFCGNSGCAQEDFVFQVAGINVTVANTSLVTDQFTSVQSISFNSQSRTLFRDTLCTAFVVPDTCYLEAGFDVEIACAGDSTKIVSTTDTSYHAINYWDLGDGTIITGVDSLKHVYKIPGTYTIKLIAFSFLEACSDTVEQQINISSDFTATGGDTITVCLEDSTRHLGPPDLHCGLPPFIYDWVPGTGLSDSTIADPVIDPSGHRDYTLVVTDSLGYADTVYYRVETDSNCCYHSVELSAKDTVVCLGDTMEFYLTGPGLLTAQWDFGTVATPGSYTGLMPPPVHFNTPGYHPVTVYYTDTCGPDTLTLYIGIARPPGLPYLEDTVVCVGDTVQIGEPSIAFHDYLWTPPANLDLPYRANPKVVVTVPATYTLEVTDRQTGCSARDTIFIDTLEGIDPPLARDTFMCPSGPIEVTPIKQLPNYHWSTGDTTATVTITSPGTYWVETEKCGITRDSFTVSILPPPVITATDYSPCEGQSVQYTLGGDDLITAGWYFGAGATPQIHVGVQPPAVTYSSTGTRTVMAIYTNRCETDTVELEVEIDPRPSLVGYHDTSGCSGDTLYLGISGQAGITYDWTPGNTVIDSQQADPGFINTVTTTYTVTLTDTASGCTNDTSITIGMVDSALSLPLVMDTVSCPDGPIQVATLQPAFSYQWSTGDTTATTTITSPGTYWVETERCGTTIDTFTVSWLEGPESAPMDTTLCQGDTVTFGLTGDELNTATWDFGPGAAPAGHTGLTPPPVHYTTSGPKAVRAIVETTCGTDTLDMTVEVHALPSTTSYQDTTRCLNDTLYLGITAVPDHTYQWSPTTGLIDPTSADPGIVTSQPTQYQVIITDTTTGCASSATINIGTDSLPEKPILPDTTICASDSITLAPGQPLQNYQWSTGSSDPSITATNQGIYWVEATNQCGTSRDTMELNHFPPPVVDAGQDTAIPFGQAVQLQGTATDSFYWSPNVSISCLGCLDPIVNPDDTITYYLTVVDTHGCTTIDSVHVFIIKVCENIALPNAFTPNGDNLNDTYTPILVGGSEELLLFQVFNRWGELLHETSDPTNGWDGTYKGTEQPMGSYTYVLRYRCSEGEEPEVDYGSVTLIR